MGVAVEDILFFVAQEGSSRSRYALVNAGSTWFLGICSRFGYMAERSFFFGFVVSSLVVSHGFPKKFLLCGMTFYNAHTTIYSLLSFPWISQQVSYVRNDFL